MPKLKTKRAAAKRFKFTATGKVKHRKAFRSHILGSKDRKRKRHLRGPGYVDDTNLKAVKQLMPYR
ncbi:MAG: 50S ribosomal protein L35 [Deferrisomatales bacterium]|nr:50S ribosomal protein L35 [Deferrisomatales bacterium]